MEKNFYFNVMRKRHLSPSQVRPKAEINEKFVRNMQRRLLIWG